ncbi:MAG: hypothetical protein LBT45_02575 [Rickettsiales bacterium]|jgi:hypothetical protein|nr:hypothetical protein [Rickettsiales bacterium]
MKKIILAILGFAFITTILPAATDRSNAARVGMAGAGRGMARAPGVASAAAPVAAIAAVEAEAPAEEPNEEPEDSADIEETKPVASVKTSSSDSGLVSSGKTQSCHDDYVDCMDQFCLLDESEGERCACSDNIEKSKSLIKKIGDTQAKAEKLYGEGVEREKLGAKAVLVFGSSEKARASRVDLSAWLNGGDEDDDSLDDDAEIGDYLYKMAAKSCKAEFDACGKDADKEKLLYSRQITADCKAFSSFLADQQKVADSNLAAAEKVVRAARFAELENTNKYNRGECLIALRNCVAEKGGCGDNFENCLDASLLMRRTNACENITNQCMAVKDYVLKDWKEETEMILADAEKYADKYFRQTCLSRTQACLEDKCSTTTNDACLNDVRVAAGICTEITECDDKIPGFTDVINSKLGYLRVRFCQNDLEACFKDKCGADYTKPECLGKPIQEIAKLCPQEMYPSCKGQTQFNVLVSSIFLQLDYAMMQGCINKFSEDLGRVCGTDMSCIQDDPEITTLTSVEDAQALFKPVRNEDGEIGELKWKAYADAEVDKFFAELEKDATIGACADTQNPKTKVKGKQSIGTSVFNTAKMIAKINAENRQYRALTSKLRELAKAADLAEAKKACELMKEDDKIDSVVFEPDLRNCHICRTQEVCEEGGESKATSALKAMSGGLAAGASAGTMVSPGWGTAIGGVVGAVGMGVMGAMSGGKEKFCQEIQSCEDVNM